MAVDAVGNGVSQLVAIAPAWRDIGTQSGWLCSDRCAVCQRDSCFVEPGLTLVACCIFHFAGRRTILALRAHRQLLVLSLLLSPFVSGPIIAVAGTADFV